ncbi:MAG TPA: lamin tail domain-containing protein, partial [bacterium]|nr:lamin tail domain-containing protein [bacterium]
GADTSYGTTAIDNLYVTSHAITIANLQPQTTYHLRAESYDVFGNGPVRSGDITITTTAPQPPPLIVVNEVMYNPVNQSTGEFIELYNAGTADVDMTGFTFSDGDSTDTIEPFGTGASASAILPAGGYALILDKDYVDGTYTIPAGTTMLTTLDSTLGNGLATDDTISLYAPGLSDPISTYGTPLDTTDGIPITSATTGKSVERRDPTQADAPGNWCISVDVSGSTPGRANSSC